MHDRACQALAKQALEPEWEARFEANSYGFRPGRGCHDAIEAIFLEISRKSEICPGRRYHEAALTTYHTGALNKLATYPAMRRTIRAWLKAGVMEADEFILNGRGDAARGRCFTIAGKHRAARNGSGPAKGYTNERGKPALIRYADDFVVLHPTLEGVEKAKQRIEAWLKIGLELNPRKLASPSP